METFQQILLAVVSAFATSALAYFGFWRQAKAELKKEIFNKFNDRKWGTYLKFISQFQTIFRVDSAIGDRSELHRLENQMEQVLQDVEAEILLIGSREVVEAYIKWRDLVLAYSYGDRECFIALVNVINCMREDLGLEKSNINPQIFDGYLLPEKKQRAVLRQT